jgi:hypothetical protein
MALRQELLAECLQCPTANGDDIRHRIGQTGEEVFDDTEVSPSGRPLQCCRVKPVSTINRDYGTPAGSGVATVNNYGPPPRR